MISTYNYSLVALSVFIGMSAAYAALDLAGRVTSSRGRVRSAWFAGGAIAMGVGIWSMHFIGMQAFGLPVPVKYDWPTVLVSLLAGLIAAACSLLVVGREKMGSFRIVGGGVIMGAAIVTVHYSGMHAMRTTADCRYDLRLVFLSVVLAVSDIYSWAVARISFSRRNRGHLPAKDCWGHRSRRFHISDALYRDGGRYLRAFFCGPGTISRD